MVYNESDLKGSAWCFLRRSRNIELAENDVKKFRQFSFIRSVVKNWFRSRELWGQEERIKEIIDLIHAGTAEEDVPEDMFHDYRTVRSILRTDGQFDLWTPDFDPKLAAITVKLAGRDRYLNDLIERNFLEMDFATWDTMTANSAEALRNIRRYIKEEHRTMIWPDKPYPVNLFGMMVNAFPHAINIDYRNREIEVIKYRAGKPDMSVKGRSRDNKVESSLRMFALWMVGKSLIPDDKMWTVKASHYFLRKTGENSVSWSPGYFGAKDCPVRTLTEAGVISGLQSRTEIMFEPIVEAFRIGEHCSGKECEECDFFALCHYNKAPLVTVIPRKMKGIADLELSESQEEAVYFREGIARVNAGAGAGKTMVVALRIAIMLSEGVDPDDILLVTFTDAAAAEMKERIVMYCEDLDVELDPARLHCMTFNSFGNEIIKTEYMSFGFTREPRLIDNIERMDIIQKLLNKRRIPGLDYRNFLLDMPKAKGALAVTAFAFDVIKKERLSSYDEDKLKLGMVKMCPWIKSEKAYGELLSLYELYDKELRSLNLIEFADQESLVFEMLDIDPYYFDKLAYKHITIDEFQDTSPSQLEIVRQLVETGSFESLMIVGDDSQSIYSFRNADPSVFLEFYEKIGQIGKDIFIVHNHRSTPEILGFANAINELNKDKVDKDLIPTRESGKPVIVKGFYRKEDEHAYIAEEVVKRVAEGYAPEDIAVIARNNVELVDVANALSKVGIESAIKAPLPMLENSRVIALIALAKAYRSINSTHSVLLVENALMDGEALKLTDCEMQDLIAQGQERIENLKALYEPQKCQEFDKLVADIVGDDEIALKLVSSIDRFRTTEEKVSYIEKFERFGGDKVKREGRYSGVVLSTAHSSKGLEYPVVFNSVSEYDNPWVNTPEEIEEARRLFFVSATRARDELIVTGVFKRKGAKKDERVYNRFIEEAHRVLGLKYSLEDPDLIEDTKRKRKEAIERIAKENAETARAEDAAKAEALKSLPKKPAKGGKKKAS